MPQLNKDEIKQIAQACYLDPVLFCKTFLPDFFPGPVPWVHRGLMAVLTRSADFLTPYGDLDKIQRNFVWEDPEGNPHPIFDFSGEAPVMTLGQFTEVKLPRGFSKTTIANAMNIRDIVYREHTFLAYISETATHAERQLRTVRNELTQNLRLINVFGQQQPDQRQGKPWTNNELMTENGISIIAVGRGGQIRGANIGGQRPSKIIVDDVEDKESVKTAEQRNKTQEWFYSDVLPALPKVGVQGTINFLCTTLHIEALSVILERDPQWTTVKFGARDREGELLWAANMDDRKLELTKKSYLRAGRLTEFYLEYFNDYRPSENAKFRQEYFYYGQPEELHAIALVIDPAISDDLEADFTCVAVVGMAQGGRIWVLDLWMERGATPRAQVNKMFEMYKKWRPRHVGVESIAYQRALVHLLREEMFRQKEYFIIEEIKHGKTAKVERVEGVLQPRYANGYIWHARRFPALEEQLLDWPNGKKDGPDSVAMAISLLDPHAAMALDDDYDPSEDEYDEPAFIGGAP